MSDYWTYSAHWIRVYIRVFIRSSYSAKIQQNSSFLRQNIIFCRYRSTCFLHLIPWNGKICLIFNKNCENKDFWTLILTKFSHVYVYSMLYAYSAVKSKGKILHLTSHERLKDFSRFLLHSKTKKAYFRKSKWKHYYIKLYFRV